MAKYRRPIALNYMHLPIGATLFVLLIGTIQAVESRDIVLTEQNKTWNGWTLTCSQPPSSGCNISLPPNAKISRSVTSPISTVVLRSNPCFGVSLEESPKLDYGEISLSFVELISGRGAIIISTGAEDKSISVALNALGLAVNPIAIVLTIKPDNCRLQIVAADTQHEFEIKTVSLNNLSISSGTRKSWNIDYLVYTDSESGDVVRTGALEPRLDVQSEKPSSVNYSRPSRDGRTSVSPLEGAASVDQVIASLKKENPESDGFAFQVFALAQRLWGARMYDDALQAYSVAAEAFSKNARSARVHKNRDALFTYSKMQVWIHANRLINVQEAELLLQRCERDELTNEQNAILRKIARRGGRSK